jgi:hypothetical protein
MRIVLKADPSIDLCGGGYHKRVCRSHFRRALLFTDGQLT